MLVEQVIVLGNILVVEIRDAEVQQDIQKEGKVEKHEVLAIRSIAHFNLNVRFNTQYPERLDQQVQAKENDEIGDEFLLHV